MNKTLNRVTSLLFQKTFPRLGLNYRMNRFLRKRMNEKDHNGIPFAKDAEDVMKTFLTQSELEDEVFVNRIKKDMVRCYLLYGLTPDEYFLHDCRHADDEYLKTILSRNYKDSLCNFSAIKTFSNPHKVSGELRDKWVFYQLAKPFFKRDVCKVDKTVKLSEIEDFCEKHTRFIAKPRKSSSGIGVHIVDLNQIKRSCAELLNYYCNLNDGVWMFEELIVQDPIMAEWHDTSVNTIRLPSVRTKKGCKVILPLFRTGKNGNVVDNCHNDGGLMAVPDAKTGVLISDGYDVFTNVIENHPNSGIKFKGWQVPRWDELVRTAAELHESLPKHHKYVGFDFALTHDGWVVIEGNWGNFPHQVCVHHGIRQEFEKLMKS